MSFLYPLGLLGLIGVPVVILIYILRSKFNEQTVSSTYIWELSEKFFKRRNPLSGLTGIISLILQILTVITVTLAIAHPIFVVPNSASEYCFVLDASGSMNIKDGSRTRFESAKSEIEEVISDARLGSSYTLILASSDTSVVYERITDKKTAREMLSELECSEGTVSSTDAISRAQLYFDENPSTLVYLATDKEYETHENVEILKVGSENSLNFALSEVSGELTDGVLEVSALVTSYTTDAKVNLELYVDEGSEPVAKKSVSVKRAEAFSVELSASVREYESFRLVISNKDTLPLDNEFVSYNVKAEESYSILIVSETPFFLEAAFDALTDSKIDVISPTAYADNRGYGLYVFHSYTPDKLPDAAVWLINSTKSVDDSGFGARGVVELDGVGELEKSASTATRAKELLSGIDGRDIYISEYVKYSGMYTRFTTLFSYGSNPLIFAGTNALGNREVVFGFDLHKSDIALSSDFAPLLANLLRFSCPDFVENTAYSAGDEVSLNITAGISAVKVETPCGDEFYVDTATDLGSFMVEEVGTYRITATADGEERVYRIYSGATEEESSPYPTADNFSVNGEQQYERTDGEYDPLTLLFILLAIIFVADWMVYCYEKYQLR